MTAANIFLIVIGFIICIGILIVGIAIVKAFCEKGES